MKIPKMFAYTILAAIVGLTGCKSDEEKKAEKQAAFDKAMEPYYREQAEKAATVEREFVSVTDTQLVSMLVDCRSAIMNMAREKYTLSEPFMVNEYSADIHQAQTFVSKGKIQKDGEIASRVKAYRQLVKESGKHNPYRLNSTFSVMVIQDTFSGPERLSRNASCDWLPGFKAEAKWSF